MLKMAGAEYVFFEVGDGSATININTGDYVDYNYETQEEVVLHWAKDILCHSEDGSEIILKSQVPDWENIVEPKFVFSSRELVVINPKTGPSVVVHKDKRVPNIEWTIIYAKVHHGWPAFLISDKYAIEVVDGVAIGYYKHFIPDLKDSLVFSYETGALVYRNGELLYCSYCYYGLYAMYERFVWKDGAWINVMVPTYFHPKIEELKITEYGKLALYNYAPGACAVIDIKNGCACHIQYNSMPEMIADSSDFAISRNVLKCYRNDGRITVITGGITHDITTENHFPIRKPTNAKSGRC